MVVIARLGELPLHVAGMVSSHCDVARGCASIQHPMIGTEARVDVGELNIAT